MKAYSRFLLWLLLALAAAAGAHTGDGSGPPTAALKRLFPTAESFVTRPLNLSPEMQKRIATRLGGKLESHDLKSSAYVPTRNGQSLGVAWVTDAHLKEGLTDVVVGLDREGKVVGVALEHSPVALLAQSSYLKQYKNLSSRAPFRQGQDLKALKSNPVASALVASAVRKAAVVIDEAFLGGKK
jgi:hypothetical protein